MIAYFQNRYEKLSKILSQRPELKMTQKVNEIQDNQFSYTLGAGGISTGSKCVMTVNLNRAVQDWAKENNVTLITPKEMEIINDKRNTIYNY